MREDTETRELVGPGRAGRLVFALGDYAGGAVVGAVTAAAVHALVAPGFDIALAMVLGMGLGTLVHLVLGLLLSPLLGMFHTMVPASLIGMYGGMLFAMRDAMQIVPVSRALGIGVVFGWIATAVVRFYDRALTRYEREERRG